MDEKMETTIVLGLYQDSGFRREDGNYYSIVGYLYILGLYRGNGKNGN